MWFFASFPVGQASHTLSPWLLAAHLVEGLFEDDKSSLSQVLLVVEFRFGPDCAADITYEVLSASGLDPIIGRDGPLRVHSWCDYTCGQEPFNFTISMAAGQAEQRKDVL